MPDPIQPFLQLDSTDHPVSLVGGKASALSLVLRAGLVVPEAVVITTDAHRELLQRYGVLPLLTAGLAGIKARPASATTVLARLRRLVLDLPLTAGDLGPQVAALAVQGTVVVRSSAPDEDRRDRAMAGVYHSELDVHGPDDIVDAVRRCWAGMLTDRAAYHWDRTDHDGLALTAVIVQRQVDADWSGVAFTSDPVTGPTDGIVIEAARADTTAITSGKAPDVLAHWPSDPGDLPAELGSGLLAAGRRLRDELDAEVDIEWAGTAAGIQILQVRPITAVPTPVRAVADQEDIDTVRSLVLGRTAAVFARQLQKKVWLRRAARDLGIPVFPICYAVYDPRTVKEEAAGISSQVPGDFLLLNFGDGPQRVPADQLADALVAGAAANPVGDGLACVQVGQLLAAEWSGIASCTIDGGIVAEVYPAGVSGMKSGRLAGTTYRLDPGTRQWSAVLTSSTTRTARLDPDTARWIPQDHPPVPIELAPEVLDQVGHQTRALTAALGEIRYEFYVADGLVTSKDITLESAPLRTPADQAKVLSPGQATGRLVRIEDLGPLEVLARRHEVSVYSHSADDAPLADPAAAELLALLNGPEPVVLAAAYPSLGLIPFVRGVVGFVFDQGSLLGHLAIVLREHGIPAVVDAADEIAAGTLVTIDASGVRASP
ncbi:PEP-utilizing enzyme [Kribbella sp. NBC_01505]|uniref:PEP/pyruvate-binding domain-containing protein n=1 Tax=Kribbella sp. NBC_01505 TaxID=2903580 RepID=UPI00386A3B39